MNLEKDDAFESLDTFMQIIIFKNLDLLSLIRMARTSKKYKELGGTWRTKK